MKHIYHNSLSVCKEGKLIRGFYYCNDKNIKYSKNGDMYIDLLLTDNKSSMYAKVWSHADYFSSKFKLHSYVAIKGKVIKYKDRLEINILNINRASLGLYSQYGFNNKNN